MAEQSASARPSATAAPSTDTVVIRAGTAVRDAKATSASVMLLPAHLYRRTARAAPSAPPEARHALVRRSATAALRAATAEPRLRIAGQGVRRISGCVPRAARQCQRMGSVVNPAARRARARHLATVALSMGFAGPRMRIVGRDARQHLGPVPKKRVSRGINPCMLLPGTQLKIKLLQKRRHFPSRKELPILHQDPP